MIFDTTDYKMMYRLIENFERCGYIADFPDHDHYSISLMKDGDLIGGIGSDGKVELLAEMEQAQRISHTEIIERIMDFTQVYQHCEPLFRYQLELMVLDDAALTVDLNCTTGELQYNVLQESAISFNGDYFLDYPYSSLEEAKVELAGICGYPIEDLRTRRQENDLTEKYTAILKENGYRLDDTDKPDERVDLVHIGSGEAVGYLDLENKIIITTTDPMRKANLSRLKEQADWEFAQVTDRGSGFTKRLAAALDNSPYQYRDECHGGAITMFIYLDKRPVAEVDTYDQLRFYSGISKPIRDYLADIAAMVRQSMTMEFMQTQRLDGAMENNAAMPQPDPITPPFTKSESYFMLALLNTEAGKQLAASHDMGDIAASIHGKLGGNGDYAPLPVPEPDMEQET